MSIASFIATDWLKSVTKRAIPGRAQRLMRIKQKQLRRAKQHLYERMIVKQQRFSNREGIRNFDFVLSPNRKRPGVSALLRLKNEEEKIFHCLASIYELFDEIIVVDNGSQDHTLEIIRRFKSERDQQDKMKVYLYPFRIARCGLEHSATAEDSLHSMTYYSNWALSCCLCRYVCKWDGDMLLQREARESFKRFLKQIQRGERKCWTIYGQTVYRDLANNFFIAKGEVNGEPRIFPNGFNPRFYKVDLYELLKADPALQMGALKSVIFYELKFTTADEFSHWSGRDIPTERKKRELQNFHLVKTGNVARSHFESLPPTFLDDQIA
jgi:hypothetical protein